MPKMARETMNARERFHATFRYGETNRVFLNAHWIFGETRKRWIQEGMPEDQSLITYFDFDWMESIPLNPGYTEDLDAVWPRPETRVIEETKEWQIIENELGGRYKTWKDREIGMNQWLSFPVRDWESWEEFKKWLNPNQPCRYPENWEELKHHYQNRDYPLGINAGSFYGWIRDWVGMENLALWYYDHPDLVHEMANYVADFVLSWIDRALKEIPDIDYAFIWEDMAMKNGPLISPKFFREFHLKPMKRVTKVLNEYGIDIIILDSDGNVDRLIPLWMEANVNLILPLEVAAGCDAVRYRRQFGKELRMIGNIDKRALREGTTKKDIEQEVMSKEDLIKEGGYSPMVDHCVPPDVPFENFKYYMNLIHELCTFA